MPWIIYGPQQIGNFLIAEIPESDRECSVR